MKEGKDLEEGPSGKEVVHRPAKFPSAPCPGGLVGDGGGGVRGDANDGGGG
jgi:hypothetical protein